MAVTGETDSLDLNFEDLEFMSGDLENLEGGASDTVVDGVDPNQLSAEEQEAADKAAEKERDDVAAAAAADPNEEAAEGESPDAVSGSSTEGKEKSDEGTSPQLYQTLATVLQEQGVLSSVEDSSLKDIKDVEGLVSVLKKQIEQEEFKDLSNAQRTILADMRAGVSNDTAALYKKSMDQLESIDTKVIEEDKQARFDLIYQDFLSKGYSEEKSSKYANRSFSLKEDLEDAKEAKEALVKAVKDRYERSKGKELEIAKAKTDKIESDKEDLKKKILESKEVLAGVDVPDNVRKEVYTEMTKIVSNDPETGVPENSLMKFKRENPVDYSHKLYYLYKVTNGFKDIDYFKGKKASSATKDLETALRQSTHVSGGGNPSFTDDGESHLLDIGELILPEDT